MQFGNVVKTSPQNQNRGERGDILEAFRNCGHGWLNPFLMIGDQNFNKKKGWIIKLKKELKKLRYRLLKRKYFQSVVSK